MKNLITFLILITLSVGAAAFVPPLNKTDIYVSTDTIYLKDRWQDTWETTTDCNYYITDKSDVSIYPLSERIKLNSKLLVKVDGEKFVCRVKGLKLASQKS